VDATWKAERNVRAALVCLWVQGCGDSHPLESPATNQTFHGFVRRACLEVEGHRVREVLFRGEEEQLLVDSNKE